MEGFDLGEEEATVGVKESEVSRDERAEIKHKVAGALKENYNLGDFSVENGWTVHNITACLNIKKTLLAVSSPGSD